MMAGVHSISAHLKQLYFGGNWTAVNYKQVMESMEFESLEHKIGNGNSMLTLVFHTRYYVNAILDVLNGNPLNAKDELSFQHPSMDDKQAWSETIASYLNEVRSLAKQIETLSDDDLAAPFHDPKYGTVERNLHGLIEHNHYHLGQITLLMKSYKESKA